MCGWGNECYLRLKIDHQQFTIAGEGTKKEALWLKKQLKVALDRMLANW